MANTFKFGNKNWAVKKDSVLAYNDENNNFKPLPFDFTRDSIATYVDSDGLIKTAVQGEARIDYLDNADGHLLLEPARTNLLPYSNDFTNGAYSKTRCTVTSNQAISPDGTQNADLMTATGDDARLEDTVGTAGQSTSMSLYVKSATGSDVDGQIDFSGANIVTFTATNEWQRIDTTLTTLTIIPRLRVRITNDGDSLYIFGGQVEYGSYPTSYIPTEGEIKTRVADACNGAGNSEVFNDSEGVLFAEISALANDLTYRSISINGYISLFYNNVSNTIVGNSTGGALIIEQLSDITSFNKIAFKYKANDFALWVNGVELGTDTSGTTSNSLITLNYDNGSGGSKWYGSTKQIQYFDTALTDAELAALTT